MDNTVLAQVGLGVAMLVAAVSAGPLVRLNLRIYRLLGFARLADVWERRLGWWVPTVRIACVVLAFAQFVMGAGLVRIG